MTPSRINTKKTTAIFTAVPLLPAKGKQSLDRSRKANGCVVGRKARVGLQTSQQKQRGLPNVLRVKKEKKPANLGFL